MKVVFKVLAGLVVLVLVALIALPFFLEKNIEKIVAHATEGKLNADLSYADIDLSLIKSFPKAQIDIQDFKILNRAPFENDTLVYANQLQVSFSFAQLFNKKDEDAWEVDKIRINDIVANISVNKEGKANYDITIEDTEAVEEEVETADEGSPLKLNLDYEINNARITYNDSVSKTYVTVNKLMHSGKGNVSAGVSDLDTSTDLELSIEMGGVKYTKEMPINLRALLEVDQENSKYTFKENEGLLNQIPLVFSGWVQQQENATDLDVSFSSEKASFKDLLASIPKAYKTDLKGVNASGKFDLHGTIKGQSTDDKIPNLEISLNTENASFKYPDLPKGIKDIDLIAHVYNTTGLVDDTSVVIDKFHMLIDQDEFTLNGKLTNLTKNPTVIGKAKGVVNLSNLKNAYPIGEQNLELSGVVNADVSMNFDMNSIEKEQYQNIKSEGVVGLSNFLYNTEELPHQVKITNAKVDFEPSVVKLEEFAMSTGDSDLKATGTLENVIPFVFSDKVLKGNFDFTANTFKVSDFMAEAEEGSEEDTSSTTSDDVESAQGVIPSFLDITSNFHAKKVYYDNLELKNAKGQLTIKDQKASLKDISADFFNGSLGVIGEVSTEGKTPIFDMELDMQKLDITQSFANIEMLQKLAPIASALNGLFTSKIKVSGKLNDDFTPDLNSLSGNAVAKLLEAKVSPEKSNLLNSLNQKTSFLNLDKLNLKDMATKLVFKDGKINVTPFDINLTKDIKAKASGSHAFDSSMAYTLDLDVPAKYMGSSATSLLSKLSAQEQGSMMVPVPVTLGGTMTQPKVGVDMKTGITSLTKQVVANQKEQLKEKATSKIKSEISSKVSGKAGGIVSDLLGGKKSTDDGASEATSKTTTKETVKGAAKNALKGLFGKK